MKKKADEMMELVFHRINEEVVEKCAYEKCKRKVKYLFRDGRSHYFLPLCDYHKFKYTMFDDPRKEERYRRYKREEAKKCVKEREGEQ